MDLSHDEQIKKLAEQIQREKNSKKLLELTEQLIQLIDDQKEAPPDQCPSTA